METAKELKFGEYKMRKDYIGTLEAMEEGETLILPITVNDYNSLKSAAFRCKMGKKMKFLIRANGDDGYAEIKRVKWTTLDGQPRNARPAGRPLSRPR